MTSYERYLYATQEMQEYLQINSYPNTTEIEALDALIAACGQQPDGLCTKDGLEECDECPFRQRTGGSDGGKDLKNRD